MLAVKRKQTKPTKTKYKARASLRTFPFDGSVWLKIQDRPDVWTATGGTAEKLKHCKYKHHFQL